MRPIPPKLRELLAADPFMSACIHVGCSGKPEWEHAFVYANRQINERWAIVPCCFFHHRGAGLNKRYNEYIALLRATPEELAKYPKRNWRRDFAWLAQEFDGVELPKNI